MENPIRLSVIVVASLCLLAAGPALGQAPPAEKAMDEAALQQRLQQHYLSLAQSTPFFADENETQPLVLQTQPLVSWTSSENGFVSGDVFVWTRAGRPELIACFGSIPGNETYRRPFLEFHALGEKKLPPTAVNGRLWSPMQPGAMFQPIASVKPAETPVRRMAQMRKLVREFEISMKPDAGGIEVLRLQARPIYRYQVDSLPKSSKVIDGAIFSFVSSLGTDPEFLLLLEAQRKQDEAIWSFAPVRFTTRALTAKWNSDVVWSCEHYHTKPAASHRQSPYITELAPPLLIDERAASAAAEEN